jgi:hypothetical protein
MTLRQRVLRKMANLKKYHQSRGISAGHEEVNAKYREVLYTCC